MKSYLKNYIFILCAIMAATTFSIQAGGAVSCCNNNQITVIHKNSPSRSRSKKAVQQQPAAPRSQAVGAAPAQPAVVIPAIVASGPVIDAPIAPIVIREDHFPKPAQRQELPMEKGDIEALARLEEKYKQLVLQTLEISHKAESDYSNDSHAVTKLMEKYKNHQDRKPIADTINRTIDAMADYQTKYNSLEKEARYRKMLIQKKIQKKKLESDKSILILQKKLEPMKLWYRRLRNNLQNKDLKKIKEQIAQDWTYLDKLLETHYHRFGTIMQQIKFTCQVMIEINQQFKEPLQLDIEQLYKKKIDIEKALQQAAQLQKLPQEPIIESVPARPAITELNIPANQGK